MLSNLATGAVIRRRRHRVLWGYLAALAMTIVADTAAPANAATATAATVQLSIPQMFVLADQARDRGDFATAARVYDALATNPDIDIRSEARFRHATMLANQQHKYAEAGLLLRRILDEQPKAARVRLELARIDALLGRMAAAGRELRAAQAAGLPPAVEQQVRFFSQAIDARRAIGGSLSIAIAPDSNINRATKSGTLNTIIGDFTLNNDAQARSGIGAAAQGQAFARLPLSSRANLLAQLSGSANLYRRSMFDDLILAPQIGPEFDLGRDRLSLSGGPAWRWYGNQLYTVSLATTGSWRHPLGKRAQLRIDGSFSHIANHRDPLETGNAFSLALAFDRALSARFGVGVQLSGVRQTANDPGYATAAGTIGVYAWREIKRTTLSASVSYSHLEADARLFLFPARRSDDDLSASLSMIFRQLHIGTISPLVRGRYDRDASTVGLYRYHRLAGEIGLAAAF